MGLETLIVERLGFQGEYEEIRWYSVAAFRLAEAFYLEPRYHTTVEGEFPKVGPALLVANHRSGEDVLKIYKAARLTSGRIIRALTRNTLLDPKAQESSEVSQRIGNETDLLNTSPFWLKYILAQILKGIGTIPVRRGLASLEAVREVNIAFNSDQMVGIFIQETRVKEGDLRNLMGGPSYFAQKYPEIPIYPVGLSGTPDGPDTVKIGESFTYSKLKIQEGSPENFTVFIADRIAELLPKRVQVDWELRRALIL